MKFLNETELMKNQRGSTVVVPDQQFEALQTVEGNSLVFSIGLDNILYVTREVPGDTHGWTRTDLSSYLSAACYGGQAVEAKTFDIAQDLIGANTVDIALSVVVNGQYYLHLATGFVNTLDNWASATPQFTQYLFDYAAEPSFKGMPINEVQILDSNDGDATQYIIVDLVTNPVSKAISRFYIDWTKAAHGYAWLPHDLPIDLQAGQVTSLLGCGPNDGPNDNNTGGVYVMGTVNAVTQLIYTPSYNFYHPEEQTESTVFAIPAGTDSQYSAVAVSAPALKAPYTDLFFASNGTLYFIACEDQIASEVQKPVPAPIYTHDLFKNIQSIHVRNWNNNIVLWGESLSTDGSGTSQLFIMECLAGQETNTAAWSCPIPLLFNVENSATYVNNTYSTGTTIDAANGNGYGSCSVLFAHQADGTLVQLFQDPVTTAWQERSLLVAPNSYTEMYETTTYSTHITISDDNNLPQANLPVSLWASSPCSVYVNNTYCTLDNVNPLNATSDGTGVISIMQPVDSIGGISYYLTVKDPVTGEEFDESINPVTGTIAKMSGVQKGTDLSGVSVKDENGNSSQLIDSSVPADQTDAVAQNIAAVYQQKDSLPANGGVAGQTIGGKTVASPVSASPAESTGPVAPAASAPASAASQAAVHARPASKLARHIRFDPARHTIHAVTFGANAKFHNGIDEVKQAGISLNADGTLTMGADAMGLGSFWSAIEAKAGHIYKWLKTQADKIEDLVKKIITVAADGIIHCLIEIADATYHFVVQCANDLANVIHTVLSAIKTAFADLVKWLGSIFNWPDILRTHKVLKSFSYNYINYILDTLDTTKDLLNYGASLAVSEINAWAGIPDSSFPSDTYSSQSANTDQSKGQHSPAANHGSQQLKDNGSNVTAPGPIAEVTDILNDLFSGVEMEFDLIATAIDEITDILQDIPNLPLITIIKRIMAVIADTMIESGANIAGTLLSVAKDIAGDFINDTLEQPLEIPVLSTLYKTFSGDTLTMGDIMCLATAISLNVIYKIAHGGSAPFPDNDATTALINAASFQEFIAAMPAAAPVTSPATSPALVPAALQASEPVHPAVAALQSESGVWTDDQNTFWMNIANVSALGGSIGIVISSIWKAKDDTSTMAAKIYCLSYVPYTMPDILGFIQFANNFKKDWYNYLNMAIAIGGMVKSVVDAKMLTKSPKAAVSSSPVRVPAPAALGAEEDNPIIEAPEIVVEPSLAPSTGSTPKTWRLPFKNQQSGQFAYAYEELSPLLECVLNLVWQVPVTFAYLDAQTSNDQNTTQTQAKHDLNHKNNIVALTANTMFNFGGAITPFGTFAPDPASDIVLGVQTVMNLGYGIMTVATVVD